MSKSYRKNPIHWVCGNTSKKDKIAYNRCFRRKDRLILKYYDDNTVLQMHKRDGEGWWTWQCDGKIHFFYTKKELLNNEELALWYKKFMRK
ncbi:hypothetical protein EPJ79_04925 [Brachyspira aalborgi]|uniref:Uncharacterized protein n=1 Tax=Brachyspira aalborgi TaxID=29522 RepID=A0A5C8D4S4_9SPIR|nr:hypothetical protein [Brachyspira aalborgi]TXJ20489.1 hypothetical protein EPJ79_04925 [Brachyspira aalborgi]